MGRGWSRAMGQGWIILVLVPGCVSHCGIWGAEWAEPGLYAQVRQIRDVPAGFEVQYVAPKAGWSLENATLSSRWNNFTLTSVHYRPEYQPEPEIVCTFHEYSPPTTLRELVPAGAQVRVEIRASSSTGPDDLRRSFDNLFSSLSGLPGPAWDSAFERLLASKTHRGYEDGYRVEVNNDFDFARLLDGLAQRRPHSVIGGSGDDDSRAIHFPPTDAGKKCSPWYFEFSVEGRRILTRSDGVDFEYYVTPEDDVVLSASSRTWGEDDYDARIRRHFSQLGLEAPSLDGIWYRGSRC